MYPKPGCYFTNYDGTCEASLQLVCAPLSVGRNHALLIGSLHAKDSSAGDPAELQGSLLIDTLQTYFVLVHNLHSVCS